MARRLPPAKRGQVRESGTPGLTPEEENSYHQLRSMGATSGDYYLSLAAKIRQAKGEQ